MVNPPDAYPSEDMIMRLVSIQDIEPFLPEVIREMGKVTKVIPEGRGVGDFQDMVQMKLIGGLYSLIYNPLLQTVLHPKRWLAIGQGDIMTSCLQPLAEVEHRLSRPGPFPVAEEMKNLHTAPKKNDPSAGPPLPSLHLSVLERKEGIESPERSVR